MRRILLIAFLAACKTTSSGHTTHAQTYEMPKLSTSAIRATASAPDADVATLVSDNTNFAGLMLPQLGSGNEVFSPFSISLCLSMAELGAATTTESAMLQALQMSLSDEALHPAWNSLCSALQVAPEGGSAEVQIANTVVVDQSLQVKQSYLDALQTNYGASVRTADFAHSAATATSDINEWVSDRTGGKIDPLFPQTLDTSTVLVLVNAIYLDASWATPFEASGTSTQPFNAPGGTVNVSTMSQSAEFSFAQTGDYTAVQLPYANGTLALLVVMPAANFSAFAGELTAGEWANIVGSLNDGYIALSLPKFTIAGDTVDLSQPLTTFGMGPAFSRSADFSRMTSDEVAISHVVHKAYIAVDEAGTVAAAATGTTVTETDVRQTDATLDFNSPFIFALRDTTTDSILFLGQVTSPAD